MKWIALGVGVGAAAGLLLATALMRAPRPSPSRARPLPVLGRVTGFALTNQEARPSSFDDLTGSVWVADIIFTRCPGPCVRMTQSMRQLQDALPPASPVRLVSLTADPAHDTPSVLRTYAERFGADPRRWQFLTGTKAELYRLAIRDLLLAVEEGSADQTNDLENLFIHSTKFVLIDAQGALRGVYDGEEASSRPRILADLQTLLPAPPPATGVQ
jgi:protein SCO1/2